MQSSLNRRQFLRGNFTAEQQPIRPPWAVDEFDFIETCTRCDQCLGACPENILVRGQGGFPEVDFLRGECSFCRACVDSCHDPVFQNANSEPWFNKANILPSCLAFNNVMCMTCAEQCELEAIKLRPHAGGIFQPLISADECSGCGACVKPCPINAIQVKISRIEKPNHQEDA